MQEQGLSSWKYPEAFVECAKALGPEELGKFEEWLVCPQGPPSTDCVDVSVFSTQNEETHKQLVAEASKLQIIDEDEKTHFPESSARGERLQGNRRPAPISA